MSKLHRTLTLERVTLALNRYPLRHIEQMTAIGKNRLHSLRHYPLDAKLHELLKLSDAGLLILHVSLPAHSRPS